MAAVERDSEGFLVNLQDWNESVAAQLAIAEDIELGAAHWEVIQQTRGFYQHYKLSPAMRPLVKYIRQQLGPDKGNSIYLMQLFPGSPAKLVSKIAGLPKPDNCL
jgi:tRNA 2-thiouridine synthesizing protein E